MAGYPLRVLQTVGPLCALIFLIALGGSVGVSLPTPVFREGTTSVDFRGA
jgi:hypothetical protein